MGRIRFGLVALLLKISRPATHPAAVGANVTFTVAVWPAARLLGRPVPRVLNSAPTTATPARATGVDPVLVRTTNWLSDVPTATHPNFKRVDEHTNWGVVAVAGKAVPATMANETLKRKSRTESPFLRDCG